MANILSFSDEVLCCVFVTLTDIRDLHNVMLSCHRFLRVVQYHNTLWKLEVKVKDMLCSLSSRCFPLGELSITQIENFNSEKYSSLKGIESVLHDHVFSDKLSENLTSRFYACKVLKSLRCWKIEKKLHELIALPESETSLLEQAILLCQWVQTEEAYPISLTNVEQKLQDITNKVKKLIMNKHKNVDPPYTATAREMQGFINQVLYEDIGLKTVRSSNTFENAFIDKVLESRNGFPVTLCIIYREMAIRMGFCCEPVLANDTRPDCFSHSFLLKLWNRPSPRAVETSCLVDASNGGVILQRNTATHSVISTKDFLLRMVEYMRYIRLQSIRARRRGEGCEGTLCRHRRQNELNFSRLVFVVSSEESERAVLYAKLCLHLDVQLSDAIQVLQQVGNPDHHRLITKCITRLNEQQAVMKERRVQFRSPSVKFAVGLVMAYKGNYNKPHSFCVINSWTVDGKNEPRYNVLLDGGDSSLVPEGTLTIQTTVTSTIDHPNIGVYFKRFDGRRYVPNAELMATYPEDEAFALSLTG